MLRRALRALLLYAPLLATPVFAAAPGALLEQLKLQAEHPVEGMSAGNLSGLAWCGEALWAVSDRDYDRVYRLQGDTAVWHAEAEYFEAPVPPDSGLPWGLRARNWAAGLVRGGQLDFEGLNCDAAGNRYLVSETQAAVLRLPPGGSATWLSLPANLTRQVRASGLLQQFNAGFEGIAIDPTGEHLWLAAERQNRGLVALQRQQTAWRCRGTCVLLSESGRERGPADPQGNSHPRDFSDLAWFDDKLFTLERLAHRICRRAPASGAAEQCWSFAEAALTDARRYVPPFGAAEGLALDGEGAWIGLDNGREARGDGERRPLIWRFAAPAAGWSAGS